MSDLQRLYGAVSDRFEVGDFGSFADKMAEPDKRKSFYQQVLGHGFDLGDYESYDKRITEALKTPVVPYRQTDKQQLSDVNNGFWQDQVASPLKKAGVDAGGLPVVTEKQRDDLPEKERGFWDSYIGDLTEKLGAGAANFGGTMYSAMDKLTGQNEFNAERRKVDLSNSPVLNKFLDERGVPVSERQLTIGNDFLKKQADDSYRYADVLRQRAMRNGGKGFEELLSAGDYSGAAGDVFLQATESLPQSLAAMFGGGAGLALSGVSAATNKYDQLDKMPETADLPEYKKVINAVSTGTFEALSEKLGDVPIGKWLTGLYKKAGTEVAKESVQKGISGWLDGMFKRYGVLMAPVSEGLEEVASQVAENVTDYCTGVTDEWKPTDGVMESFVYGAAGGAQFSMAGMPGVVKQWHDSRVLKKQQRQQFSQLANKEGRIVCATDDRGSYYVLDEGGGMSVVLDDNGEKRSVPTKELSVVSDETVEEHIKRISAIVQDAAAETVPFETGQPVMYKGEAGRVQRVEADGSVIVGIGDPLDGGRVEKVSMSELSPVEGVQNGTTPGAAAEGVSAPAETVQQEAADPVQEVPQIPLRKDGKVDYSTLLEQNPGLFAEEWEKRSTPEKAREALGKQSENVSKKIEALQKKLDSETDFNKIADIEDGISELEDKKLKIDEVLTSRYARTSEIKAENVEPVNVPISDKGTDDVSRGETVSESSIGNQNIRPVGKGFFGNIYDQFRGKAQEAIDFLLQRKEGEALGALYHPQVGDIDLVWGSEGSAKSDGFGLSKIAKYHPEVLKNLQGILNDMVVTKASVNRMNLESGTHKASVRLEWDGEKKTWLLTAFEKETPTSIDRTTDIGENPTDLQNDTAPLQDVSASSVNKDTEIAEENQEVFQKPAPKKEVKKVMTPFQKELMEVGDPVSVEEVISKAIAQGVKIKMDDGDGSRGFAAHLGIVRGSKEYNSFFNIRNEKEGFTPERLAENLLANDQSGFLSGMDSKDLTDLIIDVIPQMSSRHRALDYIKSSRTQLTDGEQSNLERLKHEEEMEEFGMPYEDWLEYMNIDATEQQKILDTVNPINFYSNFGNEHVNNTENERNIQRSKRTEVSDSGRQDNGDRHENREPDGSGSRKNGEDGAATDAQIGIREDGRSKSGENGYRESNNANEQISDVVPGQDLVAEGESGANRGDDLSNQPSNNTPGIAAPAVQLTDNRSSEFIRFKYIDGSIRFGEVTGSDKGRVVVKGSDGVTYRVHKDRILSRYNSEEEMSAAQHDANKGDDGVRFREISGYTQEESEIIEKAKAAGIYLKAPNGELTKLNEKQWVQVRTKAFKGWFGDWENDPQNASKVVNENGEPMVVYHGSTSSIDKFELQALGRNTNAKSAMMGFFFTTDADTANSYAQLHSDNVLNVKERKDKSLIEQIQFERPLTLSELNRYNNYTSRIGNSLSINYNASFLNIKKLYIFDAKGKHVKELQKDRVYISHVISNAKMENYDGVAFRRIIDSPFDDLPADNFVLFKPNQIKSATNNIGEFSSQNDNVRFRETESAEEVNARFNEELDSLTEENADGKVFHLGTPSGTLISAGVSNKPVKLYGNKIIKKMKKHGFALSELKNLPRALANPIAVFDNLDRKGNRSILTELETEKGNVLISVDLGKGMDTDFNIVSSAFGKGERNIIDWINRGFITYINKEKALDYLHHPALIAETSNSQELSSATNIVKNFDNPTVSDGEISSAIDELSDDLGVKVNKVQSRDELPDGIKRQLKGGRYPGLYDPKSGEVYVVTDELLDVADAQSTVLHEVLGHKGIHGLFGDKLPEFCDKVLESMDKRKQADYLQKYNDDRQLAAEEYVAGFAENYSDPSAWERVKAIVKDFFRQMGIDLKLSDNDLKYILWKAKNGLREGDTAVDAIGKMADDKRVQDVLFRNPDIRKAEQFVDKKMTATEKGRIALQDSALAMKQLQDEIRKRGGNVSDFTDVYVEGMLTTSKSKAAIEKFDQDVFAPLMQTVSGIQKTGKSLEDIEMYMRAKHAPERNRAIYDKESRGDGSGISDKEAARIVKDFEDSVPDGLVTEFWKQTRDATRFTTQRWMDDGLISAETKKAYDKQYEYYVPLRGWQENDGIDYAASERRSGGVVNLNKQAHGRTSVSNSPLAYIANMAHSAITVGNKNRVKQDLLNLVVNNPNADLYKVNRTYYIKTETDGQETWIEQVEKPSKELFDAGKVRTSLDNSHKVARTTIQARQHEVNLYSNGEQYTIVFNGQKGVDIANAINGTGRPDFSMIQNSIGSVTRWLSAAYTSKNPAFIPVNFLRDLGYAVPAYMIKGGNGVKLSANLMKAFGAIHADLKHKAKDTELNRLYDEFKANGGLTGYVHMTDVDAYKKNIERQLRRMGGRKNVSDYVFHNFVLETAGHMMEYMSQMSENSLRFAVYATERQAGKSAKQAAIAAKEITVNFNRKGTWSPLFGSFYAFFNASVQGGYNVAHLAKHHPGKFAVTAAGFMAMQYFASLFARAFGGDDENGENLYDQLSDYVKYDHLVLPNIFNIGNGKFLTIPLGHGFRAIGSMGVITGEILAGAKSADQGVWELTNNIFDSFSPMQLNSFHLDQGDVINTLAGFTPTVAQPVVDVALNRDFTGRQVYREPYMANQKGRVAESNLGNKNTNPLIVDFTKWMNKTMGGDEYSATDLQMDENGNVKREPFYKWFDRNPAAIEHLMEGYAAGRGKFWNNVFKTVHSTVTRQEIQTNNLPVIRRLYQSPWEKSHWKRYFELRNEVADVDFMGSAMKKAGNYAAYRKLMLNTDQTRRVMVFKAYEKPVMKLNEQINTTADAGKVEMLKERREQLVKEMVKKCGK